jgi:NAD/NADP transhydrogenase beta subunit
MVMLRDPFAWAATALAAIASLAGLALPDLYRDAPFWAQQARGIDLATLLLGTPILAAGLLTAGRGSRLGRLAVVGGLLYLIYNYAIYASSVAMNQLSVVYIAVLGLAVWSFALSLVSMDLGAAAAPVVARLPRRTGAWFLIAVAMLFGLLWLSQIGAFTFTGQLPADLERTELPANPVYALDLALFLPLVAVAGIGLLRGRPTAAAYAQPMLIWVFLTSAGIVGGFLFATLAGDEVPIVVSIIVGAVGVLAAILAALPLFASSRSGREPVAV